MANGKTKILIVEDEEAISKVFSEELSEAGFKVLAAFNGEDAITLTKKEKPDLVLLDIVLPKKNGFEVLEKLKTSADTKSTPVIMITVLEQDDDIKKAIRLGADDYIVKSQHPMAETIEKIKNFLSKPETARKKLIA